ncbi:hypothetical protein ABXT08_18255 [Chryseobacterium sp. NRRL B-14859]|uniref:hypothetical protein n=1 Tax=Chryseobacterium sp. NRRL B-14859 TaxID=1562763 RepID=UPI003393E1B8
MKTKLFILAGIIYFNFFTAQIPDESMDIAEYPNFYNQTISKLNNIIPNKTIYYGQSLSVFLQDLTQNNLVIKAYDPAPYHDNLLKLMFVGDVEIRSEIRKKNFVNPYINIYFQHPYDFQQSKTILGQYHWFWNTASENFYKNLTIKKIEFWYVNGLTNKSSGPK